MAATASTGLKPRWKLERTRWPARRNARTFCKTSSEAPAKDEVMSSPGASGWSSLRYDDFSRAPSLPRLRRCGGLDPRLEARRSAPDCRLRRRDPCSWPRAVERAARRTRPSPRFARPPWALVSRTHCGGWAVRCPVHAAVAAPARRAGASVDARPGHGVVARFEHGPFRGGQGALTVLTLMLVRC